MALTSLQLLIMPKWQWDLKFFPPGTPSGSNLWMFQLRVLGCVLAAIAATLWGKTSEGILFCGVGMLASAWFHDNFSLGPSVVVGAIVALVGASNFFAKQSGISGAATQLPGGMSVQSFRGKALQYLSYAMIVLGMQALVFPQLKWQSIGPIPAFYANPSILEKVLPHPQMWLMSIRNCGVALLGLACLILGHKPLAFLISGAGLFATSVYYGNVAVNPPTFFFVAMAAIGAYGMIAEQQQPQSTGAVHAGARRRGMPIPNRVE
jgi:hypothetical protein